MYAVLDSYRVIEIIPMSQADLARYYPPDFAARCVKCGDEVRQGWTYDGETFVPPLGPTLAEARAAKLAEVMAKYSAAFGPVNSVYPGEEREGWFLQREEAQKVLSGGESDILTRWVERRGKGESVQEFAAVVMENYVKWAYLYSVITPDQQRMYAEVTALDTVEAIQAYEVVYAMPEGIA